MLVKQELINKIKDHFGLNMYETKVWLALLGKGIASAGEIADISRVPRSRTYDVLETLEKKGFTIVKIGKPVKYIGVKPEIILERLRKNVRSSAEERLQDLLKIRETEEFSKLEDLYREGINPIKREELSAALKGKSNITTYLKEIIKNAAKEVIICTSAEEARAKFKLFKNTFEYLKKADVKIKMALSGDESLVKKISEELEIKIKAINIQAKFFIIDKKEMLFYLSEDKDDDLAIWLNSEFFATSFAALFENALAINK
jgi:sugar-specific transcriptional regulator TrmB